MKGQYEVVNEVFLFMLGILIITILATSLETVKTSLQTLNLKRNYEQVATLITSLVVHSFVSGENTTLSFALPPLIAEEVYVINCRNNELVVEELNNPLNNLSSSLFNIPIEKTVACSELSSARYFYLRNTAQDLSIGRW